MSVHVTSPMLAAYYHFVAAGFTENGAAAPVGNFCQESGEFLITTMFRAHPDASGGVADALKSGGIAEWLGDRKTAYIAFSGRAETRLGLAKGSLLNDLGTQCDFVVYELQTTPYYSTLYQELTSGSKSVANLTANFMMVYERPKLGPTANLDNRIAHAEAVVKVARELKVPKVPQTPEPLPQQPTPIPQAPAPQTPPPVIPVPTAPPGLPPIAASTAGRQAAVLDNLGAMRDALIMERMAVDHELAIIETTIADFGKLGSLPPPALHISTANPAAIAPQRRPSVFGITNWATTFSALPAVFTAGIGIFNAISHGQAPTPEEWGVIGASVSAILIGINAKDKNVTGGTIPQTVEAKQRAHSAPV